MLLLLPHTTLIHEADRKTTDHLPKPDETWGRVLEGTHAVRIDSSA